MIAFKFALLMWFDLFYSLVRQIAQNISRCFLVFFLCGSKGNFILTILKCVTLLPLQALDFQELWLVWKIIEPVSKMKLIHGVVFKPICLKSAPSYYSTNLGTVNLESINSGEWWNRTEVELATKCQRVVTENHVNSRWHPNRKKRKRVSPYNALVGLHPFWSQRKHLIDWEVGLSGGKESKYRAQVCLHLEQSMLGFTVSIADGAKKGRSKGGGSHQPQHPW